MRTLTADSNNPCQIYQTHSNNIAQIICHVHPRDTEIMVELYLRAVGILLSEEEEKREKFVDLYMRTIGIPLPKTTEYSS